MERLVFFYCSGKQGAINRPHDVLRSFVSQIALSIDGLSISQLIVTEYEKRRQKSLNADECIDLISKLITQYGQITFIVDALDECEDPDALLIHLGALYRASLGNESRVQIFFSSRYQVELPEDFPPCQKCALEQQRDLTLGDMESYVRTQIKEREVLQLGFRLLKGKHPEVEDRLISILTTQAQGMSVTFTPLAEES